jgi:four helix bundle protein
MGVRRWEIAKNMATPKTFEDLDAWKAARELTNEAYRLARREPMSRDFGLCDQFRRAALSVMNNIAEGWESLHVAEKKQFYNWLRRSCGEVRSMSYVLLDYKFVTPGEQQGLLKFCIRAGKLVSGLIRSLDNRN